MKRYFVVLLVSLFAFSAITFAGKSPWIIKGGDLYMIPSGTARKADGTAFGTSSGSGDVQGPASSTSNDIPYFSSTTGKTLADSGILYTNIVQGPASATSGGLVLFNGTGGKTIQDASGPLVASGILKFKATTSGVNAPVCNDLPNVFCFNEEFGGGSTAGWTVSTNSNGTVTAETTPDDVSHPGVWGFTISTTIKSRAAVRRHLRLAGGGAGCVEHDFSISALSNGTDEYDIFSGWMNSSTDTANTDSVALVYDRNTDTKWVMQTCNNTACTNTATSLSTSSMATVTTGYHDVETCVNAAWSTASFYVDHQLVGTQSTNLPGITRTVFSVLKVIGNAGTTSISFLLDAWREWQILTTAR